jgi:hypothetical protein
MLLVLLFGECESLLFCRPGPRRTGLILHYADRSCHPDDAGQRAKPDPCIPHIVNDSVAGLRTRNLDLFQLLGPALCPEYEYCFLSRPANR